MITLASLAQVLNARLVGDDKPVHSISTDSRKLVDGDVFVALRGEHFDGHDFLPTAVANGAAAVVVDAEQADLAVPQLIVKDTCIALGQIGAQKRKLFKGVVIAVTGSSGKTSVKGMLRDVLSVANDVVVTPGNFNNHIGVPLSLMRLEQQTHAVIEVGTSHPGEIGYLADLVLPDVAVVNNIMAAHIGGFGSLAAIAQEKSALYKNLTEQQCAVINTDDEFCPVFEEKTQHCRRIGFSVSSAEKEYPVLHAKNIRQSNELGMAFDLVFGSESVAVQLRVPGTHSVKNAVAAAACALAVGCPLTQIAQGLTLFCGEAGRMQRKPGLGGGCVIDDTYNANPGSVKAAIEYLSSCGGKRVLVLGDLGELGEIAEQVHQDLGAYARQQRIDAVYAVGRFAKQTAQGAGDCGVAFETKQAMVDELTQILDSNTTVLVKGSRSARMEEVVKQICLDGGKASC